MVPDDGQEDILQALVEIWISNIMGVVPLSGTNTHGPPNFAVEWITVRYPARRAHANYTTFGLTEWAVTTCTTGLSAPKRIGHSIPLHGRRVNDGSCPPVPFNMNVVEGGGMTSDPSRLEDFRWGALYVDPTVAVLVPNRITSSNDQ